MKQVKQEYLSGERALFQSDSVEIENSVFGDGESPLKHSSNILIKQSIFKWKYPLWYCNNIEIINSSLLETARSGIWYTDHITIKDSMIEAPKTFRKSSNIVLENVDIPLGQETFWNCKEIRLQRVSARGDYFMMNSEDIVIDGLQLTGNYCFDGAKNIVVHHSRLLSKDAFWNCENVTVYDSTIIGEYLAWNSKNVTFINCTIESLQGLCYVENLKMINCTLINTSLAFEYSTVDVEINSHIDSIINPISGIIRAKSIGEVTMNDTKIDPAKTKIIVDSTPCNEQKHQHCICC